MNRSILIVICDFLLVSLLAFSSVDINKVAEGGKAGMMMNQTLSATTPTNASSRAPTVTTDLASAMRTALEEERKSRDTLAGELARTKETLSQQQLQLAEREGQSRALQTELAAKQDLARRLETAQQKLERQYALGQSNIATLSTQLKESTVQSAVSQERLQAMEAELQKQILQAETLQGRMQSLEQSNAAVLTDRQKLSAQLQVTETQKEQAARQVEQMQQQVRVEREERARLADNVKQLANTSGALATNVLQLASRSESIATNVMQLASKSDRLATNMAQLATKSDDLKHEIREYRPQAANTIFHATLTNRVRARFTAFRSGMLGIDANRRRETETIIVTNGTNYFGLCHVADTPFVFGNPAPDWESLGGTLTSASQQVPITSLSFGLRDPRVVLMPITKEQVKQLGVNTYKTAGDPYKFQDAVLVGATEGYYGECRFQIDLSTPDYVKLDNSFVKGIFGKFNPSRGDLVFSRNGELIGIMANNTYCLMLKNFNIAATVRFSQDVKAQNTGRTLSTLYSVLAQMPPRLQ